LATLENSAIDNDNEAYFNFINTIKSEVTKKVYEGHLKQFMKYCSISSLSDLFKIDAQKQIINYIMSMRKKGLAYNSISVRLNAIFHFYSMNDVILNKKKIKMFKGGYSRKVIDRPYTRQEISKILQVSDLRMKSIISLMACTGIRIGAVPSIQIKNLQKVSEIYKLTVYEGSKESYFTFTTPECTSIIDSYLEFRESNGEKLNKDSYLIRDQFDITDIEQIRNKSKGIKLNTLRQILSTILIKAGVRTVDHTSSHNRKEVAKAHGFRKFTMKQFVDSKLNVEIREMLMGHKIGLASAYYRPTEQEMYQEYMKAVNLLTISEENRQKIKIDLIESEKTEITSLKNQVNEMKATMKDFTDLMKLKLESDKEQDYTEYLKKNNQMSSIDERLATKGLDNKNLVPSSFLSNTKRERMNKK
jgi:integrase